MSKNSFYPPPIPAPAFRPVSAFPFAGFFPHTLLFSTQFAAFPHFELVLSEYLPHKQPGYRATKIAKISGGEGVVIWLSFWLLCCLVLSR